MGYYVNPQDMTKEDWLSKHGTLAGLQNIPGQEDVRSDYNTLMMTNAMNGSAFAMPVVLVDNGPFTAAAIAYNKAEYERFLNNGEDKRPMLVFLVDKHKLDPFLPEDLRG